MSIMRVGNTTYIYPQFLVRCVKRPLTKITTIVDFHTVKIIMFARNRRIHNLIVHTKVKLKCSISQYRKLYKIFMSRQLIYNYVEWLKCYLTL